MSAARKSCQRSETALASVSAKTAPDNDPSRPGTTRTAKRRPAKGSAAFRPTSVAGSSQFGFQPNRSTPP